MNRPSISVVVPTYRRPEVLAGCLRALIAQDYEPCEVLVCRRSNDEPTAEALAAPSDTASPLIREVLIGPEDNFAKALQAGIAASRGDLVALTDDDAEAPADWLAKLVQAFDSPDIGACGGRDMLPGSSAPQSQVVGRVQWFGRVIGRHHDGVGPARDVDVLKGVNCCFRGDLIRSIGVDPRLRGAGNVVHTELAMCLPIRRAGYRIVYDPSITVRHHVAPRMDGDDNSRGGFNAAALRDAVHNETLQLLDHLPLRGRVLLMGWSCLIGTARAPGLIALPKSAVRWRSWTEAWSRMHCQFAGRLSAIVTAAQRGVHPIASEADSKTTGGYDTPDPLTQGDHSCVP